MAVHKMFERENWTLEKIIRRYKQATEDCPDALTPSWYWWAMRKKDKN